MDPLTKEERESFRQYAGASLEEPDGSECQWANHTLRLLDEADRLREENARLRQRVEELERAPRCCADTIPPGCRTCRCADAAEARLAQAMKILRWLRNEAHALLSLEREGIIELVAITNVRALEAKIAEADAALAAAQPEEEK